MTCIHRICLYSIQCGSASRCCARPASPTYACAYGLGCQGPDCEHDDCPRKQSRLNRQELEEEVERLRDENEHFRAAVLAAMKR